MVAPPKDKMTFFPAAFHAETRPGLGALLQIAIGWIVQALSHVTGPFWFQVYVTANARLI